VVDRDHRAIESSVSWRCRQWILENPCKGVTFVTLGLCHLVTNSLMQKIRTTFFFSTNISHFPFFFSYNNPSLLKETGSSLFLLLFAVSLQSSRHDRWLYLTKHKFHVFKKHPIALNPLNQRRPYFDPLPALSQ